MYTAIRSYDEQAFDISEESEEKKTFHEEIIAACSKGRRGWAGQKNMAASDPSEVTQETPEDPRERGGRRSPDEGYN